jgi:hypothetical protein
MGKKSKIHGATVQFDLPVTPPQPIEEVKVKEKRIMSEKQKENLSKGMAALKAKREAGKKKHEEETTNVNNPEPIVPKPLPLPPKEPIQPLEPLKEETVKKEIKPIKPIKPRKPRVVKNLLTVEEFSSFKEELYGKLNPRETVSAPQIMSRPPVQRQDNQKEKVLSGSALLDRIFFS